MSIIYSFLAGLVIYELGRIWSYKRKAVKFEYGADRIMVNAIQVGLLCLLVDLLVKIFSDVIIWHM